MKKQVVLMKQAVAPLQAAEVGIIRRKLTTFDVSLYACAHLHGSRSLIVHKWLPTLLNVLHVHIRMGVDLSCGCPVIDSYCLHHVILIVKDSRVLSLQSSVNGIIIYLLCMCAMCMHGNSNSAVMAKMYDKSTVAQNLPSYKDLCAYYTVEKQA